MYNGNKKRQRGKAAIAVFLHGHKSRCCEPLDPTHSDSERDTFIIVSVAYLRARVKNKRGANRAAIFRDRMMI